MYSLKSEPRYEHSLNSFLLHKEFNFQLFRKKFSINLPTKVHCKYLFDMAYSKSFPGQALPYHGIARLQYGIQQASRTALMGTVLVNLYRNLLKERDIFVIHAVFLKLIEIALLCNHIAEENNEHLNSPQESASFFYWYVTLVLDIHSPIARKIAEALANQNWIMGQTYYILQPQGEKLQWLPSLRTVDQSIYQKIIQSAVYLANIREGNVDCNALDLYNQLMLKPDHEQSVQILNHVLQECEHLIHYQENNPYLDTKIIYEQANAYLIQLEDIHNGDYPHLAMFYAEGQLLPETAPLKLTSDTLSYLGSKSKNTLKYRQACLGKAVRFMKKEIERGNLDEIKTVSIRNIIQQSRINDFILSFSPSFFTQLMMLIGIQRNLLIESTDKSFLKLTDPSKTLDVLDEKTFRLLLSYPQILALAAPQLRIQLKQTLSKLPFQVVEKTDYATLERLRILIAQNKNSLSYLEDIQTTITAFFKAQLSKEDEVFDTLMIMSIRFGCAFAIIDELNIILEEIQSYEHQTFRGHTIINHREIQTQSLRSTLENMAYKQGPLNLNHNYYVLSVFDGDEKINIFLNDLFETLPLTMQQKFFKPMTQESKDALEYDIELDGDFFNYC